MNHASVELIEAMHGIGPFQRAADMPIPQRAAACVGGFGDEGRAVVYASNLYPPIEDIRFSVTCPDCLKLMLAARGPDADYLAERAA